MSQAPYNTSMSSIWAQVDQALADDNATALDDVRRQVNPRARGRLLPLAGLLVRAITTHPTPTRCLDQLLEQGWPWPSDWLIMGARQSTRRGIADWKGVLDWCEDRGVDWSAGRHNITAAFVAALDGQPCRVPLPMEDRTSRGGDVRLTQAAHLLRELIARDPGVRKQAQNATDPWNWFPLAAAFPEDRWADDGPQGAGHLLWYGLRTPNRVDIDDWLAADPRRQEILDKIIDQDRQNMAMIWDWQHQWLKAGKPEGSALEQWWANPSDKEAPLDHPLFERHGTRTPDRQAGMEVFLDLVRHTLAMNNAARPWTAEFTIGVVNKVNEALYKASPGNRREILMAPPTPLGRKVRNDLGWWKNATSGALMVEYLDDGRFEDRLRWVALSDLLDQADRFPELDRWTSRYGQNLLEYWLEARWGDPGPTRAEALAAVERKPHWLAQDSARHAFLSKLDEADAALVRRRMLRNVAQRGGTGPKPKSRL